MNTDQEPFRGKLHDLTERIIRIFFGVYNELGYGFLESVYQGAMRIALIENGLEVETEVAVPVYFHGQVVGLFRADLVVNGTVLLELKSLEALVRQHESQTLHYLRSTEIEVALLKTATIESVSSVPIRVKSSLPEGNEWE
jgi:GxxExxY protein